MDEEASSSKPTSDDPHVRFEDVTNETEDLLMAGDEYNDKSDDETRCAHTQSSAKSLVFGSKQDGVQKAGHCFPAVSVELQTSSTAESSRPSGHMYSRVQVGHDARVHLGDSYAVHHHYSDSSTTNKPVVRQLDITITGEFCTMLLALMALIKNLMQTSTGALILLQVAMSAYRLPKQISDETAVFEDALGRFQRIDLRFLDNWPAFRRRLECDFRGTPGSRRILKLKYRLFHRVGGSYLVDPRHPPPFASVFKHGRHVQMSIHFEWDEVSDKQCPRCGLKQECQADSETICAGCEFSYRNQVESGRVGKVGDEETPAPEDIDNFRWPPSMLGPTSGPKEQDAPSSFSRITISKQPVFGIKRPTRSEGPKVRPWICMYPGCLDNKGHLTSFWRKDDLNRHLRTHMPYRELYPCPVAGCARVGENGLPRKDKLIEHVKTHRRTR